MASQTASLTVKPSELEGRMLASKKEAKEKLGSQRPSACHLILWESGEKEAKEKLKYYFICLIGQYIN